MMKLSDYDLWDFSPLLKYDSLILCPECNEWTLWNLWKQGDVHCVDCGSHIAMQCPKCLFWFDSVYSSEFQTKRKVSND